MLTKEEQVFCLFHQKLNCDCIVVVTSQKDLEVRLKNAIKNNEISNKFCLDEEAVKIRELEIEGWRERLGKIN